MRGQQTLVTARDRPGPDSRARRQLTMLSPKMQRGVRINDNQLLMLAEKARYDRYMCGSLYKRTCDNSKWQQRWFNLYQVGVSTRPANVKNPRRSRSVKGALSCCPLNVCPDITRQMSLDIGGCRHRQNYTDIFCGNGVDCFRIPRLMRYSRSFLTGKVAKNETTQESPNPRQG